MHFKLIRHTLFATLAFTACASPKEPAMVSGIRTFSPRSPKPPAWI